MKKLLWFLLLPMIVFADDFVERPASPTSVIEDSICIPDVTGQECLHVDEDVANLIIEVFAEDGTQIALYDAGAELEDIAVIGTYATPSANNVRVSPQGGSGNDLTQIMLADAVYAGENRIKICVSDGGTTIMDFCRTVQMEMQTNWVTASVLATDSIGALEIQGNAIGASELAADAIGASEIGTAAIDADAIATNAIGAQEVADDAIDPGAVADNTIDAATFASNAIDANALAANAVDEIWDEVIETAGSTYTARCAQAIALSYQAGTWSTSGAVSTFKDPSGASNRIVGTITSTTRGSITITCP